jgi:hypothetical protein
VAAGALAPGMPLVLEVDADAAIVERARKPAEERRLQMSNGSSSSFRSTISSLTQR